MRIFVIISTARVMSHGGIARRIVMKLDDSLRAASDELVAPGSAVANFHNTADWMKMRLL